jgi:hypothetical protein
MKNLVGLPIGLDHQAGPEFQRIIGGVAGGGLVEPAGVGEVAEVAELEQAVEAGSVLPLPAHRQVEGGQDTTVEVAEDQVAGDAHGGPLHHPTGSTSGRITSWGDPSGSSDTPRKSPVRRRAGCP